MQTILHWLESDTIKALALAFVLNGLAAIFPTLLPTSQIHIANEILLAVAGYFRINLKTNL